ncbi:hypothetical protein [Paenibacillus rigui]|uniref:Uncharacterized protein n=1 Tax=Paenibacillus rigui TaxID=554312 RepID=A0A229UMU9_9BACL|nr:hypothetical protein [Paenibacillus rigui]OXM84615.1 hypothetical protein CF651_19100 [Paenibacillus rigui]
MANPKTTNLGLNKIDRTSPTTTYMNLQTNLDDNWDNIDNQLGAQIAVSPAAMPVSLKSGLQVINSSRVAPYNVTSIKGRTLVNLLGRDGGFEVANNNWTAFQGTITYQIGNTAPDTGQGRVSLAITSGSYVSAYKTNIPFKAGKYYVLISAARNFTATSVRPVIGATGAAQIVNSSVFTPQLSTFTTQWSRINVGTTDITGGTVELQVAGAVGQTGVFDSVRLYEITQAEYDALASMTPEQVAAKYPYVDDVKPITNPYVIKYGENLLPTMYECSLTGGNAAINVQAPYILQMVSPDGNASFFDTPKLPLILGQQYTLSATISANAHMQVVDSQGVVASITATIPSVTFIIREFGGTYIRYSEGAAGTHTYTNPMLSLGAIALPFKQREDDYLILPAQLHANTDGSVYDEITYRDGQYFKNSRFKSIDLDGSLAWTYSPVSYTGYKRVELVNNLAAVPPFQQVVKYDGKILTYNNSANTADTFLVASGTTYIVIPNTDSGWGDSYTPSAAEIQAYFYGWKMTTQGVNSTAPYDRTDNQFKQWYPIGNTDGSGYVITLPTVKSSTNYKPYKLVYQLAVATTEVIPAEGGITLHDGGNQLEVGAGMVVRERIRAATDDGGLSYYINTNGNNGTQHTEFAYRLDKLFRIYRGLDADYTWMSSALNAPNAYGKYWYTNRGYDKLSGYAVTYTPLDSHLLTGSLQAINGEYSTNLKTAVDKLARNQADVLTRVSVLETQKTGKVQPQIIKPTLLNGWSLFRGGYYKGTDGRVYVDMGITGGVFVEGTQIMQFPQGYAPLDDIHFEALASTAGIVAANTIVEGKGYITLGKMIIYKGANGYMHLAFSFRAE